MKYISWIVTLPLTIIAVIFAVSNLNDIAVAFWPFEQTFSLPLYIAVLATFVFGFVCGGVVLWFSAGKLRRKARKLEFEAVGQKREIADLKQRASQQTAKDAHRAGATPREELRQIGTAHQTGTIAKGPAAAGGRPAGQPGSGPAPARLTGS